MKEYVEKKLIECLKNDLDNTEEYINAILWVRNQIEMEITTTFINDGTLSNVPNQFTYTNE